MTSVGISTPASTTDCTPALPVLIGGHTSGIDLTTFANNPGNKIDQIVIGSRGMGFPKELFFGSTSNFILHKAKAPVTVVK